MDVQDVKAVNLPDACCESDSSQSPETEKSGAPPAQPNDDDFCVAMWEIPIAGGGHDPGDTPPGGCGGHKGENL